jgi:hypothetical protein
MTSISRGTTFNEQDISGVPSGLGQYVDAGKVFSFAGQVNLGNSNADNPTILFMNPVGSGVDVYFNTIHIGLVTPSQYVLVKTWINPTVTANGTPQTPINNNIGGSETSAVDLYTEPSISNDGTQFRNMIQGASQNSIYYVEEHAIKLSQGQSIMITGMPKNNNKELSITITWTEI